MNFKPALAFALCLALFPSCADLTIDESPERKDRIAADIDGKTPTHVPDIQLPDVVSTDRVEHLAWAGLVSLYSGQGNVAYSTFTNDLDSHEILALYFERLAGVDVMGLESDSQRLAFWINAYNASVFLKVAQGIDMEAEYEVNDAIYDVPLALGGLPLSANGILHGVLRGDATHPSLASLSAEHRETVLEEHASLGELDPRILMALCDGKRTSPALRSYTAENLDAELEDAALTFIAGPYGATDRGLHALFFEFESDFGGAEGVRSFISERASGDIDFGTALTTDSAPNGE